MCNRIKQTLIAERFQAPLTRHNFKDGWPAPINCSLANYCQVKDDFKIENRKFILMES